MSQSIDEVLEDGAREAYLATLPKPDRIYTCQRQACEVLIDGHSDYGPHDEHVCDNCGNEFCRAHLIERRQEKWDGDFIPWRWCFTCAAWLDVEAEWDAVTHAAFEAGFQAGMNDVVAAVNAEKPGHP